MRTFTIRLKGHDPRRGDTDDLLDAIVRGEPGREALLRLHDQITAISALSIADPLITELRRRQLPPDRLREVARHLAEHGSSRDTVKIGIVLLGGCGDERDRELLLLLGTLEELTLYAVVALLRTQPDRQRAAFELARRVRGWGRIHAVERLKGCDDLEVKGWLLREGFRNGVMNEYLAHLAATTGDLYSALLEPEIDDALLDGAGGILAALAVGGPAEDMADYPDAVPAMRRFADLTAERPATLGRLSNLLTLLPFLRRTTAGKERPWTTDDIALLRRRYENIIAEPRWSALVLAHLSDPHRTDFNAALWAAKQMRLPVLPQIIAHLKIDPLDGSAWYHAIHPATADEAAHLCLLAEQLLPLPELANGPGDHRGFGAEYVPDRALEFLVRELGPFPGSGLPLIQVSLANRLPRLRRAALAVLSAWPPSALPKEADDWIRQAATVEPNEHLRKEMLTFLQGRT